MKGRLLKLSPLAEEMAYNLAKKVDTPYVKDAVFLSNFMSDFVVQLPAWSHGSNFEDLDFSQLVEKVRTERGLKEVLSREDKKAVASERKERRERLKARFGIAVLDGKRVEIANWMVEPPGLFMGRGEHPIRGRWKPRVSQEEVVLNLDENAPVPPGRWKTVVHDHDSMWMARWVDKLTEKEKYVWLHESSPIQQSRSRAKYDNAAKVGSHLEKIRATVIKRMGATDAKVRQLATVCYLIDALGMRVGDEKDDDEADTVGATTLRVEHVNLKGDSIEFRFLGKDSVPWNKALMTPPAVVVRNVREFLARKGPDEEVFHNVSSSMVNQFLSSIVPGVTAKVFRTYHATEEARGYLASKDMRGRNELEQTYHAKEANLKAAVFCNHQRTPPKTWEQSLEKKQRMLAEAREKAKPGDGRVRRLEMELDFYIRTKDYNLNTSMKNYIDPRVYKAWCDYVGLEWTRIYSKSLQRKFSWVGQSRASWERMSPAPVITELGGARQDPP